MIDIEPFHPKDFAYRQKLELYNVPVICSSSLSKLLLELYITLVLKIISLVPRSTCFSIDLHTGLTRRAVLI